MGKSSCFTAGTKVRLADNQEMPIEKVELNHELKSPFGKNKVLGYDRTTLGERKLYAINDDNYFYTAEHPFLTTTGWRSIDPDETKQETKELICGELKEGDILITDKGLQTIHTIKSKTDKPDTPLYNFFLDGDQSYYANDFVVHNKGGVIGKIIGGVGKVFKKVVGKIFDFIGDVIGFVLKPFGLPDIPDFNPETAAQGVKLQKPGTNQAFPIIYGYRRVGSVPIFAETNGSDNQDLYVVYAICEGEIQGIRNIKVDGNTIGNSSSTYTAGTTFNGGYPYDGGRFAFQCFNGTENQSQSTLMNGSKSWGSAKRTLPGLAYVAARFRWIASTQEEADRNPFGGGLPQLEFDVYGKKVYDVTTHAGGLDLANDYADLTKTYTTNPASCLLDYIMNPRYGAGYGKEYINADAFKTAGDKFDTTVVHDAGNPGQSTSKIITCNGVISPDAQILENVKKLLSGCRTMMPFVQGRYKLKVEDGGDPTDITSSTVTVAFDVTADHIIGQISLSGESKESKYNQVIVNYIDPDDEFSSQQEFFNTTGDLAIDDNETLTGEFTFDSLTNRAIAKDFARMIYQKSRNQRSIAFTATQELMDVEVGDIIRVTDTVLNLNQQTFRVVAMTLQNDSTVKLEAVEHDATIYPHVSTTQREINPKIFLPNTIYNYVRTAPQNPAPENYNNGITSAPPQLVYNLAPQINQYDTAFTPLPNSYQLVDADSFMLQHIDPAVRYALGGAVDILTNRGYQFVNFGRQSSVLKALSMNLHIAPPVGGLQFSVVINIYEGVKHLRTITEPMVRTIVAHNSPNGGLFSAPSITSPVVNSFLNTIEIPIHPALSYKIRLRNQNSQQTYVMNGDISSWSGFTSHQYKIQDNEFIDTGLEGLVNYVADNYSTLVAQFPNGSNFVNNSGGSVNLGG